MIEQNKAYEFYVSKQIDLPILGHQYVMLAGDGTKHLMPADIYADYNICVGKTIRCYVDKINCVGKIFLEPEHPFFKRGEVYTFRIKFISEPYYKKGKYRRKIYVSDENHELIEAIPSEFNYNIDLAVPHKCKLIKIKKAKLVITNSL